jgi:hypothetical protein
MLTPVCLATDRYWWSSLSDMPALWSCIRIRLEKNVPDRPVDAGGQAARSALNAHPADTEPFVSKDYYAG